MAIKLSGNTIIDDSRVIVNADKIGIGQTTPRYDLEIHSNQYGTDIPIGIAVSATNTQGNDTNKAISVFNNSESSTFTVSYRGRVDALEYYGVFKGSIDPGVAIDKADKIKIQTDSSNAAQYLTFVDSTSGYEDVKVHTGIKYNPDFYGNGGSSRLSIDGDVGIAGTLTYEDVTNVDSIGLVTARTGVRITTGGLIVNSGISSFGAHIYPLAHETHNIGESDSNRFNAVYAKEFRGGTFYGDIDGGVNLVADTVKTVTRGTDAEHYLTFVDSNNSSATAESMYTDGGITYNPNDDQLTVSKIKPAGILNASGNSGTANYVIKANGSGGWDWGLVEPGNIGTLNFTDLDDTPANYTGAAGKLVRVNSGANGLEFMTASDAGKTYTLEAVDSGDNAILRLSDGATNDDVLITAGSNITIDPVAAGGFTIAAVAGAGLGVAASADDILSVTNAEIVGDDAGSDKIVFWDDSDSKLTYLTAGTGLTINGTTITANSDAGKTYTLQGVDSGDNAILRLSDGTTDDDVLITAGTGITLDSVAADGFTINATGSGSLSNVDVKQFSNHTTTPKTERTCPNPIEVNISGIGATIGIGSTSNAYGTRFIQNTAPSTGVCEGDIWFDTSGGSVSAGTDRVAILRDEKAGGVYGGRPGAGEYANYRAAYMHDGVNEFVANSWFPRNINTKYDPNNFVSVVGVGSTGTFGLESGSYKINWRVPAQHVDRFQSRIAYNTNSNFTGVTTYYYGSSQYSGSDPNIPSGGNYSNSEDESEGEFIITIASTTYFKIEQWIYTEIYYGGGTDFRDSALGVAINRDSNTNAVLNPLASPTEVYTQIKIEDLATAVKEGASVGFGTMIEQGDTRAEVIDTGTDGRFIVKTNGVERFFVDPSGYSIAKGDIRVRREGSAVGTQNNGGIYFGDSNSNYIFGEDSVETLTLTGGSGNFIEGETVTGGSSGKTAIVKSWNSSSLELVIHDKTGSFQNGETVTSPSNTTGRAVQSFSTTNADVLTFSTASDERLRITSTGDVGIGIVNPATKLDVNGGLTVKALNINTSGAGDGDLLSNGGSDGIFGIFNTTNSGQILFTTKDSGGTYNERFRFGSAGQLGIAGANYGTSGQVLTSGGASGAVSWSAASGGGGVVLLSEQTATGTSVEFTGIPSDALEITLIFDQVSLSGNDQHFKIQLGTSSGYITSGYDSLSQSEGGSQELNATDCFVLRSDTAGGGAADRTGSMLIKKASGTSYVQTGQFAVQPNQGGNQTYGSLSSVTGTVDRLRVTLSGSNTFDAGTFSVSYKTSGSTSQIGTTKVAILRDRKDQNIAGGYTDKVATGANASWNDRDLTVKDDPQSFVTLYPTANGQTTVSRGKTPGYFSLPAGTYKIRFKTGGLRIGEHVAALIWSKTQSDISSEYNPSSNPASSFDGGYFYGTTPTAFGNLESGANPTYNLSYSTGSKVVTITDTHYFKLIHYNDTNPGYSWAWGSPINTGASVDENNYTLIEIEDLAPVVIQQETGKTKVAILKDEKNNQKDGGTFNAGDWKDRDLTIEEDPSNFVTFTATPNGQTTEGSGNTPGYWSLPAGDYKIDWTAPAFDVNRHKTRLVYSTTESHISTAGNASTSYVEGSTENTSFNDGSIATISTGHTILNLTQTTWFKIMHYCSSAKASTGFGRRQSSSSNSDTGTNIYTQVRIEDLATAVKEAEIVNTGKTRVAILRDKKNNSIPGGKFEQDAWRGRDLTEEIDPQAFVNFTAGGSVSSESDGTTPGTWSLAAGTYDIEWSAPCYRVGRNRSRLTYSTASNFSSASYAYSASGYSGSTLSGTPDADSQLNPVNTRDYFDNYDSHGKTTLTLTATTYFKIEHYGTRPPLQSSVAASNLGFGIDAGRSFTPYTGVEGDEIYTTVKITDLATAVKEGFGDKIQEGNTKAEVVDTGSNGHFLVETEGTERLRITDSGIVKITNSEPQVQLIDSDGTNQFTQIIQSSSAFNIDLRDNTNDGQLVIRGKGGDTATDKLRIKPTSNSFADCDDIILDGSNTAGTNNNVSGVLNMGMSYKLGNLGDGSGHWSAVKLHLYKSNTGTPAQTIDNVYGFGVSHGVMEIQTNANLGFFVGTAGAGTGTRVERLRITPGGIINMGGALTNDPVTISGNVPAGIKLLGSTGTAYDGYPLAVNATTIAGIFNRTHTTGSVVEFKYNANVVGSVNTNGSGVTYSTGSDYRLKENVVNLTDGITRLKTLKPYRFNFKTDTSTTVDGFLAHEVTTVPEAITGTKDQVDSDNNPVYQQIDQSKLVPLLVAALQEAVDKIETLETKVAALEG